LDLRNVLKPGIKGAFYGRFSTKKQNIQTQLQICQEFVKRYGCKIVEEYKDEGVSARIKSIEQRTEVVRLISDAEQGKFDFVVISNHDRFARNPKEHQIIRLKMAEFKIPVFIASSESLYNSGDFILDLVKDGNSKLEVENTRVRTRDTMRKLVRNGEWAGGPAPYGYRYERKDGKVPGRFMVDPVEREIVRQIFKWYQQDLGFLAIANRLPKGSRRDRDWNKDDVKAIITNPFYAGYLSLYRTQDGLPYSMRDEEEWILGKNESIEPIIEKSEWDRCWSIYKNKKSLNQNSMMFQTDYLLQSLLYCGHCKRPFKTKDYRSKSKNGKTYGKRLYRCKPCKILYDIRLVHQLIPKILAHLKGIRKEDFIQKLKEKLQKELDDLKKELHHLENAKEGYQKNIEHIDQELRICLKKDGEDSETMGRILLLKKNEVINRYNETIQWIADKDKRIAHLKMYEVNPENIEERIKNLYPNPEKMDPLQLRRLLVYLVEIIWIDRYGNVEIKIKTLKSFDEILM
jgi:site-specific DNA recombinase